MARGSDVRADGVRVRAYREQHRPSCLEIFDSNVPEYFLPSERAEFGAFLTALPGPYLVLEDEKSGVVACGGFAVADAGRIDLCWGMVRRELQGRGLGRRLTLERVNRALAHEAAREIVLQTSHRTAGFYQKLGFEVVSVEKAAFGPELDRCTMRREVQEPPSSLYVI